jgi:hypothetical protein
MDTLFRVKINNYTALIPVNKIPTIGDLRKHAELKFDMKVAKITLEWDVVGDDDVSIENFMNSKIQIFGKELEQDEKFFIFGNIQYSSAYYKCRNCRGTAVISDDGFTDSHAGFCKFNKSKISSFSEISKVKSENSDSESFLNVEDFFGPNERSNGENKESLDEM